VYTSICPACAGRFGWVGAAPTRLRDACLISGEGKASLPPRKQKHFTLRDRSMLYCGELMMLMLIMLLTYLLMQNNYGGSNHRKGTTDMSIKQTLAQLKAMGCKATYSHDWQEYRVTLPNLDAKREEAIAYYCSDAEEALQNGAYMKGLN